jgi:hypothetical protein
MNFVTQIAEIVRKMSDEELCKLAINHLPPDLLNGKGTPAPATKPTPKKTGLKAAPSSADTKRKPGRPAGSKNKTKAEAAPKTNGDAVEQDGEDDGLMLDIELFVRKSSGVATSEVADKYEIEKDKAASILKKLVVAGRIARGGEKRFSRYAKDQDSADEASASARGLAPLAE